jgi:HAD superfamily hydrolase (TIGR01450 family)
MVNASATSETTPKSKSFDIAPSIVLDSVLDRYDGFLVDQWGVMHNGVEAMPGAAACIAALAVEHNKKLVILSNSPSSELQTLQALQPLGLNPSHFDGGAVTSGMLASEYIRRHYQKVLCWGWKTPGAPSAEDFLEQCCGNDDDNNNIKTPLKLVNSANDKPQALIVQGNEVLWGPDVDSETGIRSNSSLGDFVLTGETSEVIDPLLKDCAKHKLPLICVDPDFVTVNPDGSTYFMPGTVAKRYEELGGQCIYFGKPHVPAFEEGIRRLQAKGIAKDRMAMIGDSLHHDVAGANAVDLDSILLLGGVHRTELALELGEMTSRNKLEALFEEHGQIPTLVAPMLKN